MSTSRLRSARVSAGLSTEELAAAVGLRPGTLRQAERLGCARLAWPRVLKLARLLETNPLDLIG